MCDKDLESYLGLDRVEKLSSFIRDRETYIPRAEIKKKETKIFITSKSNRIFLKNNVT